MGFTEEQMLGEAGEIDLEAAEKDVDDANKQREESEETKTEESVATGDEPAQEQNAETQEETSEESTEESELERLQREFTESGQANYHSGISDMIAKAGGKDRYITQLEAERAALKVAAAQVQEQPTQPETPFKITADDLVENPQEAIVKLVKQGVQAELKSGDYMTRTESAQQNDEQRGFDFINNTKDFNELVPAMKAISSQIPSIQGMPFSDSVKLLYRLVKAEQKQVPPKPKVEPADGNKKERASTSGGTPNPAGKPGGKGRTREQMINMSEEELEEGLGFSDEQ